MNRNDVFKIVLTLLISVLTWVAIGIHSQVREVESRLRSVEQKQSAILARIETLNHVRP